MSPELTQMLPYILIGFLVGFAVVWLMARANRKTTIIGDETSGKDVLDEGAAPAARNQALIDAPTAMEESFGQTTANANTDAVAAAPASADAEAGASVSPKGVETVTTPDPDAPEPAPLAAPTAEQKAPAPAPAGDDLRQIKGLGPKLVAILADQGITRFSQIAAWTDEDVARVDATLGKFAGRITRDQWVEQAKLLESGDKSGFSDKFGNNT